MNLLAKKASKVFKSVSLLSIAVLSSNALGYIETCRDNVGSSVTIETASWGNNQAANVTFSGETLIKQFNWHCYPDGVKTEAGYENDATILNNASGTEIGLSYVRGPWLCKLRWEGSNLQLQAPQGKVLWNFDAGCESN